MATAEDLSVHMRKAAGDFPVLPATLYWRVFMIADKHLKSQTIVETRYHGNIAKFFAIMWRYFFENKNMNVENGKFNFPFDGKIVSTTQLASVNSAIDNELRLFLSTQDQSDPHLKILNIMRMGDIGLKIKKIIMTNHFRWTDPNNPLNDNTGSE